MEVNFNTLRLKTLKSLNGLTKELNSNMDNEGRITMYAHDIQEHIDDLISRVTSICCSYKEGCDDVRDLADEMGEVEQFNPNDL